MQPRVALRLWQSSCLRPSHAEIADMHHQAWVVFCVSFLILWLFVVAEMFDVLDQLCTSFGEGREGGGGAGHK